MDLLLDYLHFARIAGLQTSFNIYGTSEFKGL